MGIDISGASTQDGSTANLVINEYPDHCPVCHKGIEALRQKAFHFHASTKVLEIVFRCPRGNCQSLFIGRYNPVGYSNILAYTRSYPFEPPDVVFSEHIREISPQFCAIQNQAQKAENHGLRLIAGPGYRKALEFLIKDYLCLTQLEQVENIKASQLGTCIETYVQNEKVKAMAARAVWLGNDETHYTRKWEDKDLEDLKKLATLTVLWIEMEAMTMTVLEEMPDRKRC